MRVWSANDVNAVWQPVQVNDPNIATVASKFSVARVTQLWQKVSVLQP